VITSVSMHSCAATAERLAARRLWVWRLVHLTWLTVIGTVGTIGSASFR